MASVLKIVKKSSAFTGMRIFRAEDRAQVYSSTAIADVAIADTFTDETAVSGKVYFYGVELYHATDKTQLPIITASDLADYGPFTAVVAANVEKFSAPTIAGNASFGLIQHATLAQFSNQPGPPNTSARFSSIFLAATGVDSKGMPGDDAAMAAMLLDGKLHVIPASVNFYLRSSYTNDHTVNDVTKVVSYLAANPEQALFDISGYRWRAKVVSKEFMQKYPQIFNPNQANGVFRAIPHITPIAYAYEPTRYTYSEVDGSVSTPFAESNGTITFGFDKANTSYGRVIYMCFEYVGPTPA